MRVNCDANCGEVRAHDSRAVSEFTTEWLQTNKQSGEAPKMSMDTELLGSGLLDSFDFLDLIVYIETKSGHKIDLAIADSNEFSVVRGLWKLHCRRRSRGTMETTRAHFLRARGLRVKVGKVRPRLFADNPV